MKKAIIVVGLLAATACSSNSSDTPQPTPTPGACTQVVEAKLATYGTQLADWSTDDLASMHSEAKDDSGNVVGEEHTRFAGRYRDDLTKHPGCKPRDAYNGTLFMSTWNEGTVAPGVPVQSTNKDAPGYVPGYTCAAKEYTMPSGVSVDPAKPIVILVHGNSANPNSFEEFKSSKIQDQDPDRAGVQLKTVSGYEVTVDTDQRTMLAAKLVAKGYRVIALDLRTELAATLVGAQLAAPYTDANYGDAIGNVDHGWSVPILQALIKAVMVANPDRKVSIVAHSLGYTVAQDALRRLWKDFDKNGTFNPFPQLKDVILASGAAHGVASGQKNCSFYKTMRGTVNCEMGDRENWVATAWNKMLEGPEDLYSTPCADGSFAFGKKDQCGGNVVQFTTVTMKDPAEGKLQDEFVSMASSRLSMDKTELSADGKLTVVDPACVDNHLIELTDVDTSGYFMDYLPGMLASHFGSIRSEAGMDYILKKLGD